MHLVKITASCAEPFSGIWTHVLLGSELKFENSKNCIPNF
jgi:hypothetical protein